MGPCPLSAGLVLAAPSCPAASRTRPALPDHTGENLALVPFDGEKAEIKWKWRFSTWQVVLRRQRAPSSDPSTWCDA